MKLNVREVGWKVGAAVEWVFLRTLPGNLARLAVLKAVARLAPEASQAGFVQERGNVRRFLAERWGVWKAVRADGESLAWTWLLMAVGVGAGLLFVAWVVGAVLGSGRLPNALESVGVYTLVRWLVRAAVARMNRRDRQEEERRWRDGVKDDAQRAA